MTITRRQLNSETNEQQPSLTISGQRRELLKTCQSLFAKELTKEEVEFWGQFLNPFSTAELKYAFDNWNRNGRFFPKPKDISDLCDAFRLSLANQNNPVGCHRCNWTGFYQVKPKPDRVVSPCPCRTKPQLRERRRDPHEGRGYGANDIMWLYKRYMATKDSRPNREMTENEINKLLDELDAKRGESPEWRKRA